MSGSADRGDPVHELRAAAADFRGALARLDAELANLDAASGEEAGPVVPVPRDLPPIVVRPPVGPVTPVDDNCRALLEVVRKRCPTLLPAQDVAPGGVVAPVPVGVKEATALLSTSLRQSVLTAATGRLPLPGAELPTTVLWEEGADALVVEVSQCRILFDEGLVSVSLPVRCDQLPDGVGLVTVVLVVGTADRPTGMFTAASTHPQGPAVVVQRWGEALTALAWQALLDVARGIANHAGRDADGAGLVPVALVAAKDGLVVLPQARHPIDRVAS